MQFVILSRWAHLYSTQSLFLAAKRAGHYTEILDYASINTYVTAGGIEHVYDGDKLPKVDGVIGRISPIYTPLGSALLDQFAHAGAFVSPSVPALKLARDKWQTLTALRQASIPIPDSAMVSDLNYLPEAVARLGGYPVVVKLLQSTHGEGVTLAHSEAQAYELLESYAALNTGVMLQRYVAESGGADVRAFVVGGEVVASMLRTPQAGEFRSNLHRGGSASVTTLTTEELEVATASAKTVGLGIAGVDFLRSNAGPLVMEVNASPGLEGIEMTTGIDVAGTVVRYLETEIAKRR